MALLVAAVVGAVAGETAPTWDHLPAVGYRDEALTVVLRAGDAVSAAAWRLAGAPAEATAGPGDDPLTWTATFTPGATAGVRIETAGRTVAALDLVAPGAAAGVLCAADGRLVREGRDVVLVPPRVEAGEDRRWSLLRPASQRVPPPCRLVLPAPLPAWGRSSLLAQVAVAQGATILAGGVLVQLGAADIHASWKHRAYRQALAWLVEDLRARGATRLVLVQPAVPKADEELAVPLRKQVRDVGRAYACEVVETAALGDDACWQVRPGVLGDRLNDEGRRRLDALCAPFRAADATVAGARAALP